MQNALTWSEKFNCGHSDECYFGSLRAHQNAIMVYRTIRAGKLAWQIMFNDASMRFADVEHHPSLAEAQAYAAIAMLQPICDRGYRSLANNAALIASSLCTVDDCALDIEVAIALARVSYPDAKIDDIRRRLNELFDGNLKRAA